MTVRQMKKLRDPRRRSLGAKPDPLWGNMVLLETWSNAFDNTGVQYEIPIIDEHNYFFLWSGPQANITITQGPNVAPLLPLSINFDVAPGSLTHINLNCNAYTTRNC